MTPSQIDQLARLDALRQSGALSEDEFAAQKASLLAGRTRPRWLLPALGGLLAAGAAVAIGVVGGREAGEVAPAPSPTPSAATSPAPTLDLARLPLAEAMRAATGHSAAFEERGEDGAYTVSPERLVPLPDGRAALIVSRELKDGCHACAGSLGIYYLRVENGRPALVRAWPEAVPGQGFGGAPASWSVTDRFTTNPAIWAEGGYTGQGITVSSATITELTASGPVTSDKIGIAFSDEGAAVDGEAACEVTGKVGAIEKDRGFDVAVTGSRRATDRYVKRDGRFVTAQAIDWEVPCG